MSPTMRSDTLVEACACTYRQIDYWVRAGYLHPTRGGTGSGHWRRWPESEARVAIVMSRLIRCGFAVPDAARIARAFIEQGTRRFDLVEGVQLQLSPAVSGYRTRLGVVS